MQFKSTIRVLGEYLAQNGDYDLCRTLVECALREINEAESKIEELTQSAERANFLRVESQKNTAEKFT